MFMLWFFPVVSTWLFALWWLGVACWDCLRPTSPRYCNRCAVALALLASGQLALVGALLLREAPAFLAWGMLGTSGLTVVGWLHQDALEKISPGAATQHWEQRPVAGDVRRVRSLLVGMICTPSGTGIAGATGTVQGSEPRSTLVVHTNAAGVYVVMDLPPGQYDVTAHAPGFTPGTVTGVSLTHWQVQHMDLTLSDFSPNA
jgi:Carboxypeptidase regulatory-like domain